MYERRHSLAIADYGGVATAAPWLSTIFLITTLASIGLPMLNNFVGEFLVLQGTAQANFTWTVFAALGVILSACYMLWMYQRVFFGEVSEEVKHHMPDFNPREWACMIPLVVMMVWMGIYTQTFLPAGLGSQCEDSRSKQMNAPLRVSLPPRRRICRCVGGNAMPVSFVPSGDDLLRFAPETILTIAGTLLMVLDPLFAKTYPENVRASFDRRAARRRSCGAVGAYSVPGSGFSNLLVVDGFGTFFRVLVLAIGILAVLSSYRYLDREKAETGEYHALLLFSIVGPVPDGRGQRSDHDLHRPRDLFDRHLHPRRLSAQR